MKKVSFILLVLLGSTVILCSCHKVDEPIAYQVGGQAFVTTAMSSFNFEVQAGKLAMSHSQSDAVKAIGDTMVNDNSVSKTKLMMLASQKDYTVSGTLTAQDQNNLNALTTLSGIVFDKAYATMMVNVHMQITGFFNTAASFNGLQDTALRGYASTQLPGLQAQLVLSQQLQQTVSNEQGH